jgi:hypothetical protein
MIASTPNATPTSMPAFAPVDSELLLVGVVVACDAEEVLVLVLVSLVMSALVLLVAIVGVPVSTALAMAGYSETSLDFHPTVNGGTRS